MNAAETAMTALASKIDSIKEHTNIRSRDIAQLLGTTPQTISRWKSGESSPPTERLRKLLTLDWIASQLADYYTASEARIWIYSPHPLLDGDSPADRIEEDQIDDVLALIDQLDSTAIV